MDNNKLKAIIKETILNYLANPTITVGVSNRHLHLSQSDQKLLFTEPLTPIKYLIAGNFAAKQTVTITGNKGQLTNVRILGPSRNKTQVEISLTETFTLGVSAPINESGNLTKAATLTITNPLTGVSITRDAGIVALRHIHMSPEFSSLFGFVNKQWVKVAFDGSRATVFDKVLIRIHKDFTNEMHIDTDEANSANIKSGDIGRILL